MLHVGSSLSRCPVHQLLGSFEMANSFYSQTPDEVSAVPVGTRWPKPYVSLRSRFMLSETHFLSYRGPRTYTHTHRTQA